MKKLLTLIVLCALASLSASAQNSKTTTKMLYHGGPVLTGAQDVYVIWYGNWIGHHQTMSIITDFISTIGNTNYMRINSTYADASGQPASAAVVYGGSLVDGSYSHSTIDLTDEDIQEIIYDAISNFRLPQDPNGIYVVIASADFASPSTGSCIPGEPPYHGSATILGGNTKYIFLIDPNRCPSLSPQFISNGTILPTPHDNFAGDALASNLAHALDATLTNPYGTTWFDRYGLENADKCANTFGQTYLTANGARANMRLPAGDFLIQQNWVNDRRGRCALSL